MLDYRYAQNEWFIRSENEVKFYDLYIRTKNTQIIIEYHGVSFHPKSEFDDWISPFGISAKEQFSKDHNKKILAETNGFVYYEIFSDYNEIQYRKLIEDIISNEN